MILPDYNTYEDYSQFTQLLMLHGFKTSRAVYVVNCVRLHIMAKRLRAQKKAPIIYRRQLDKHRLRSEHARTPLACIIAPHTDKLKSIPAYHRYVGWQLQKGRRKAHDLLGVSRMSLYRWIVKHHYHTAFTMTVSNRTQAYRKRKEE